ncbi:MAG: hypothetical protein LBT61_05140 [Prevotellaceae bacterium]|nr:hypothetical protein [Prevotellaceae bacterium]
MFSVFRGALFVFRSPFSVVSRRETICITPGKARSAATRGVGACGGKPARRTVGALRATPPFRAERKGQGRTHRCAPTEHVGNARCGASSIDCWQVRMTADPSTSLTSFAPLGMTSGY